MGCARSGPATSGARGRAPGRGLAWAVAVAAIAAAAAPFSARAQEETGRDGAAPAPAPAGDPGAGLASVEEGVRAADTLLREARFEEALDRTERLRAELAGLAAGPEARRLRARTEVMAATAYVALDREDAARECFRRALAAEPALDLDPATTPPKVLRVFRTVRAEPRGPR
jgi:tetratricopeptide (TPR) repeat protein